MPEFSSKPSLLIEGWRGINQSYALINQYQMLELLAQDRLRLFARDLPFFNPAWSREANSPDFSPQDQARVDAIPPPEGDEIDCVYRISSPFHPGEEADRRRTLTFMITEMGLQESGLVGGRGRMGFFTQGENRIITTTAWSRARIAEFGFPAEKIDLITLAADQTLFNPVSPAERAAARAALDVREDETLFVNVGGAFWNKGGDLLLAAFARLRQAGRKVRLIIKDQRELYGLTIEQMLGQAAALEPAVSAAETMAGISLISTRLTRGQLRSLYGIADAYVSPYRAEGFNLPVLEAIACGTPVIVTQGGATDDFCPAGVALHVPGPLMALDQGNGAPPGRYVEPSLEALVAAMAQVAAGRGPQGEDFARARANVLARHSWAQAARDLTTLATGGRLEAPAVPAMPAIVTRAKITQADILALLRMMRPWATRHTQLERIGNEYDGGYVLPDIAWEADAVLSIGVGPDVSFDRVLAERGARILQFDHTVEGPPVTHPHFTFHKTGWGAVRGGDFITLADMAALLDAAGATRPLLKFDIEGGEYEILSALPPAELAPFEIVTCEIHDLHRLAEPDFYARAKAMLETLTAMHRPVHLHGNNYRQLAVVEGVPVPEVLELTFLRVDADEFPGPAATPIPGPLDRPNHPGLPDLCFNPFALSV